ncbi:hypothetical protein ACFL5P_01390, partial [candidate division KSB1 bacterium]
MKRLYKIINILLLTSALFFKPSFIYSQYIPDFSFKDMAIGMGFNHAQYDFSYPEVSNFENRDIKKTLLIDVRVNFEFPHSIIVSPVFQHWSWTDRSGSDFDLIQNGFYDYMFGIDFSRQIYEKANFKSSVGGGFGTHLITYWTKFPRFNKYYELNTGSQIQKIIQHKTYFTPDFFINMQYQVISDFYLITEIRREFGGS